MSDTEAPGAADFTFGSLLIEMIRHTFQRVESLAPDRPHRFYTECKQCGGNDMSRKAGQRPSLDHVQHRPGCLLAKHLPRLRAMANKDVT